MNRAPPRIFSRRRVGAKFARSQSRQAAPGAARYLGEMLADDVIERIGFMRLEPSRALLVGDMTGRLARWLEDSGAAVDLRGIDRFDAEQPGPVSHYDLMVHLLGFGMVNDLPGALIHAHAMLSKGGLMVAAFPGAGSLPALRQIALAADGERPAARMHPLVDSQAGAALLQRAGFSRQVVDSYPLRVRFASFDRMVADLRDHGLTGSLTSPAPMLTRDWLDRARKAFDALREDDGKVTETFEILVMTGWKS
ncbi:methyltransferase domain-containing protein [Qipengyuania sp. CAU 1752]